MMKFRRIYWVTEQVDSAGCSEVTGIFTSIPDLVEYGVGCRSISEKNASFRISLCELDSQNPPIARIDSKDMSNIEKELQPVVETGELSKEELLTLKSALDACVK